MTNAQHRGVYASIAELAIAELAKAEGVNQSCACRMMRLTLLAPGIVAAVHVGRHSSDSMLKDLMKPLPARWAEQPAAFRNSDRTQGYCYSMRMSELASRACQLPHAPTKDLSGAHRRD
jgi:hypothetical protein